MILAVGMLVYMELAWANLIDDPRSTREGS